MKTVAVLLVVSATTALGGPLAEKYKSLVKDGNPSKSSMHNWELPDVTATNSTIQEISLEHSGCRDSCPSYYVSFKADGTVTYEGYRYVKRMGKHERKISSEAFEDLARLAEIISFTNRDNTYSINVRDDAGTFTYVKHAGGEKVVYDYARSAPIELRYFEDQIDKMLDRVEWLPRSPEKALERKVEGYKMDFAAYELTYVEAFDALDRKWIDSNPFGEGLRIHLNEEVRRIDRKISLAVKRTNPLNVLKFMCLEADLDYRIDEDGVYVFSKGLAR